MLMYMNMKDLKPRLANFYIRFLTWTKGNWPFLVIIFIALVFFYPVLFQKRIPLPTDALVGAHIPWTETVWEGYPAGVPIKNQEITDAISQFYPWRSLAGEFWRAGKVPLWNFYMFNGTPFLATLHSAVLYPLNFIYLLFRDENAWSILVFLQIVLSGIFTYILLRSFKLRKEASILGGLAFAFSGYMIAWLEFTTGGHAGLWLPLLLYFERRLILSKDFRYFFVLPLTFFMIFTAGDFQVPLYITLTYFMFGIYEVIFEKDVDIHRFKKLVLIFLAFLLGVLLAAPQLLPTIELFSVSVRVGDPYIKQYFYGLMDWEKITNFIWPDFFGNIVTRNYWGKYGFHEYLSYVGIIPLVLVFYSLFLKKLNTEKFFWLLLLLSLLFLFPTPLAFLPYKLKVPGLGTSSASRIIFLTDFCLAVLSAYGFDKWLSTKNRLFLKVLVYFMAINLGIGLGLLINILIMNKPLDVPFPVLANLKVSLKNMIPQALILSFMTLILLFSFKVEKIVKNKKILKSIIFITSLSIIILTSLDLLRFSLKNTPFGPLRFLYPSTKTIDFLQKQTQPFRIAGGMPTNLFMQYKFFSGEGYDPIYPFRNSEWYSIVDWGNTTNLSGRYGLIHYFTSPLINFANIKYIMDYKKDVWRQINKDGNFYEGVEPPRYKEVYQNSRIYIFENTESLPYIWLTNRYEVIKDSGKLIDRLNGSHKPLLLLESDPGVLLAKSESIYSVSEIRKEYNEISFNVVADGNSLLFLSESFYQGWKAYVDGQEEKIFRANYIFQSIFIPKGDHKIRFIYQPVSFKIGKWISLSTLIFLIGYFIYEKKRLKTRKGTS
ncbi:MAG: hypothetical protein UT23_C0025G0011 [Candidatus Woesebacteria bacterium GW2011_GWA1_39_12]|uniref:Bacterial membrane protein YfhO n=3 Tax=Candidatus Woeseibacteriota TaxID=1752722 RepID=A0A0G0M8V6_9BACT|nr:MAG: hypothetical protein UT23_C0025G0011 [Candidatus Woesebacteria bacterium GW2011_GWA1_39_12]